MADKPFEPAADEEFICLDEFPDNTTVLVPKPTDKKVFVYSELECFLERVPLEAYIAYRKLRLQKAVEE